MTDATQTLKTVSVTKGSSWIDVRDVGLAHALALEKEDAGGKRLLVSAGPYIWQDFSDYLKQCQNKFRVLRNIQLMQSMTSIRSRTPTYPKGFLILTEVGLLT